MSDSKCKPKHLGKKIKNIYIIPIEVGVCSSAILISSYKLSMEFTDNVFGTEDFSDNLLFGLGLTWMVVAEKW